MRKKILIDDTVKEICEDKCQLGYRYITNIYDKQTSVKKIKAALMLCAKALATTLGPNGSTTIVESRDMKHLVTKDGLDVINSIRFADPVANIVLHELRNIASRQVVSVGDGSTSAIIIANALYQAITDLEGNDFEDFTGKDITDILAELSEYLEKKLLTMAKPISKDLHELEMIAAISTNNDPECGAKIREAWETIGPFGHIDTNTTIAYKNDTVEYVTGLNWQSGYIDNHYGDDFKDKIVKYNQPKVFICRGRLDSDDIQLLSHIIGSACGVNTPDNKNRGNLVIIAQAYSDDVKIHLSNNRHMSTFVQGRTDFNVTPVTINSVERKMVTLIDNLAVLSGAIIYDKTKMLNTDDIVMYPDKYLGSLESATITQTSTTLITNDVYLTAKQLDDKNALIENIKADIAANTVVSDYGEQQNTEVYYLRASLAQLTKSTAIYHVGGATDAERINRERLLEDAIYATKSALQYGYIFGGNLAVPMIIRDNKEEMVKLLQSKFTYLCELNFDFSKFIDVICSAFKQAYLLVLNNSSLNNIEEIVEKCVNENLFYNLKTHRYEKIDETLVINSVATDIEIMKTCFSIIGLLSTSSQVVTTTLSQEL